MFDAPSTCRCVAIFDRSSSRKVVSERKTNHAAVNELPSKQKTQNPPNRWRRKTVRFARTQLSMRIRHGTEKNRKRKNPGGNLRFSVLFNAVRSRPWMRVKCGQAAAIVVAAMMMFLPLLVVVVVVMPTAVALACFAFCFLAYLVFFALRPMCVWMAINRGIENVCALAHTRRPNYLLNQAGKQTVVWPFLPFGSSWRDDFGGGFLFRNVLVRTSEWRKAQTSFRNDEKGRNDVENGRNLVAP